MKNIYTILKKIDFEDKCNNAEELRIRKEWNLKQFSFSLIQAFYEQILKDEEKTLNKE